MLEKGLDLKKGVWTWRLGNKLIYPQNMLIFPPKNEIILTSWLSHNHPQSLINLTPPEPLRFEPEYWSEKGVQVFSNVENYLVHWLVEVKLTIIWYVILLLIIQYTLGYKKSSHFKSSFTLFLQVIIKSVDSSYRLWIDC